MKIFYTTISLLFIFTITSFGQGVAIVDANQGTYFQLLESHVQVDVNNQIAVTKTTHVFKNTSGIATKITYGFPLSESASTTNIRWFFNGYWTNATMIAAPQDTSLPGSSGSSSIDPNLETFLGATPLNFKLNETIDINEIITVELTYVELLPYSNNVVSYSHPNDYTLIQSTTLDSNTFDIQVNSARDILSLDLLSHVGSTVNNQTTQAFLAWNNINNLPNTDFDLEYSLDPDQLGLISFSTYLPDSLNPCDSTYDGYFAMIVEPDGNDTVQVIDKVFTLIVDVSGSMSGNKMQQAKDAATYIVNHLNFGDKFNIIQFSSTASGWQSQHQDYTAANQTSALNFIGSMGANGGTNFTNAFNLAIPQFSFDTTVANIIIFLTDGLANESDNTVLTNIATQITANNLSGNIAIHTFGIGDNVNESLLSLISTQYDGIASFAGSNDLFSSISSFYSTIRNPVLLNVQASFSPSNIIHEMYPLPLPNLYKGEQMLIVGRYSTPDSIQATFNGQAFGNPTSFQYDFVLADTIIPEHQFLTKIWAKMKIENLMTQYYNAGNDTSLTDPIDELVTELSLCYGITSPLTSFIGFQSSGNNGTVPNGFIPSSEAFSLSNRAFSANIKIYPNPFHETVTIGFQPTNYLSRNFTLRIYDEAGRLVQVIEKVLDATTPYKFVWDGTFGNGNPVPTGVYYFSIAEEGEDIAVGKLIRIE